MEDFCADLHEGFGRILGGFKVIKTMMDKCENLGGFTRILEE
jgi:hypothetical protein